MSKSVDAFRTISEVADELEVQKHVLRFWEVKFPQIRPMKRGGGRRYYRLEDMVLLRGIQHLLHAQGYTIKGVQKILREQGVEQVKVHGLAATALADARSPAALPKSAVAAASKKSTATLPPAAVSGRVRLLPKAAKSREAPVLASPLPAVYRAALDIALRELRLCREALLAPVSGSAAPSAVAAGRSPRATRAAR